MNKEKIFYARTYRRMKINVKHSIVFGCVFVLPALFLYFLLLENIINGVVQFSYWVLTQIVPGDVIQIQTTDYAKFWEMSYLVLPTSYPQFKTACIHLLICLMILAVISCLRKTGRPMAIFSLYCMFVHVINCTYFIFARQTFPYTVGDYSEIYLKQQIGVWMMFILMAGFVLGSWGNTFLRHRIAAFAGIMTYSLVFGVARYIVFMFLLYRFSVIYMAIMFFVIGPMVDFAYFVMIYASFMNKMTTEYDKGDKRGEWGWS